MYGAVNETRLVAAGRLSSAGRRQAPRTTAFARLIAWVRRKRQIRRVIGELQALDDHQLSDIGLSRASIEDAARYGRPSQGGALLTDGLAAQPGAIPPANAAQGSDR